MAIQMPPCPLGSPVAGCPCLSSRGLNWGPQATCALSVLRPNAGPGPAPFSARHVSSSRHFSRPPASGTVIGPGLGGACEVGCWDLSGRWGRFGQQGRLPALTAHSCPVSEGLSFHAPWRPGSWP